MTHLSDGLLNEILDETLAPEARAAAEAHLAACPDCSTRLVELRALFAALDSLAELPLEVDFSPVIVARLGQTTSLPRPIRWLTALQAIGAVLAAGLVWPLAKTMLPAWNLPSLQNIFSDLTTFLVQTDFRFPHLVFDLPSLNLDLPATTLTVTLLGAALFWLAANGLLLIPRSRRTP